MSIFSSIGHPDEFIWKKLTIDDKYINKWVRVIIHQPMFLSGAEKKNYSDVIEVYTSAKWLFNYFLKCAHETVEQGIYNSRVKKPSYALWRHKPSY